jgi:hypothetical protein
MDFFVGSRRWDEKLHTTYRRILQYNYESPCAQETWHQAMISFDHNREKVTSLEQLLPHRGLSFLIGGHY